MKRNVICGRFLKSVLGDPSFSKYHAQFGEPKDPLITSNMYDCAYAVIENDSIDITADDFGEDLLFNELGGNDDLMSGDDEQPAEEPTPQQNQEATQPQ